ncbi:MAG: hypothetical protein ACI35P_01480 [Bacillus sp. (in: firmicutes)]
MGCEQLQKEIIKTYKASGKYPKNIKLNKDLLIELKEAGYISLSPSDPSKVTFLGIEVLEDHKVDNYELV